MVLSQIFKWGKPEIQSHCLAKDDSGLLILKSFSLKSFEFRAKNKYYKCIEREERTLEPP